MKGKLQGKGANETPLAIGLDPMIIIIIQYLCNVTQKKNPGIFRLGIAVQDPK